MPRCGEPQRVDEKSERSQRATLQPDVDGDEPTPSHLIDLSESPRRSNEFAVRAAYIPRASFAVDVASAFDVRREAGAVSQCD